MKGKTMTTFDRSRTAEARAESIHRRQTRNRYERFGGRF